MDAFRTLTGGSNFDRKRFKQDINHFQPSSNSPSTSTSTSTSSVPAELDFFATPAKAESKKDKKRKRAQPLEEPSESILTEEPPVDLAALIRKHKIKLSGLDLPSPVSSLASLSTLTSSSTTQDALKVLEQNWKSLGMKDPTGIQMASWGIMLSNRDILACAPTGSGKTYSFILPLLALNPPSTSTSTSTQSPSSEKQLRPRAVVIEPTRELAVQVLRETRRLAGQGGWKIGVLGEEGCGVVKGSGKKKGGKKGIKKGKGKGKEKSEGHGEEIDKNQEVEQVDRRDDDDEEGEGPEPILGDIDILITTPLRLVYALKSSLVSFANLSHLILDEADKLFELNFLEQTDEILAACSQSQTRSKSEGEAVGGGEGEEVRKGMFSATMPSSVEEMAKSVMAGAGNGLVRAIVGHKEAATSTISQDLLFVNTEDHKLLSLRSLITNGQFTPPVLIFVQSIQRAKELTTELLLDGLSTDCIHAERSGEERDLAVREFAQGKVWCLVCTDVMGRGIDFKGVRLVVNYDFPQSAMSYIHRIGRTGRAGKDGKAITFFTKADAGHLKTIVNVMRQSGCKVPDWMLALANPSQDSKKALKMRPIGRKDISKTNGAGAADDVRDGKGMKGKRERVMGGKGGVFKRREGEEVGDQKKKKNEKKKGGKKVEGDTKKEVDEGERKVKRARKGKVDMDE